MLGSITIFGGSKGMVAMPNLSGLTQNEAISAIQNAGLISSAVSSAITSTSSNNGKIASQSITAGTLVDYETPISIEIWSYQAPSGPVITFVTDTNPDGTLKSYTVNDGAPYCNSPGTPPYSQTQKRKNVYLTYKYIDGVKDPNFTPLESPTGNPTATSIITDNVADCGYTAPPAVTCTTTASTISTGTCSNGFRTDTLMNFTTCSDGSSSSGSPYNSTVACCVSLGTTYSGCSTCKCGFMTCDATSSTLCGTVTTTHPSTKATVSCVGGGLGGC